MRRVDFNAVPQIAGAQKRLIGREAPANTVLLCRLRELRPIAGVVVMADVAPRSFLNEPTGSLDALPLELIGDRGVGQ